MTTGEPAIDDRVRIKPSARLAYYVPRKGWKIAAINVTYLLEGPAGYQMLVTRDQFDLLQGENSGIRTDGDALPERPNGDLFGSELRGEAPVGTGGPAVGAEE